MEIESREKVKKLLRELFQFDTQDLDFGIYRIMNFKRDAIERFIEKDLLEAAEAEFREYARVGLDDLQRDVERLKVEINRDFGAGTIDEQGRVVRHRDAPKVQQYLSKLKELESAQITQAQIDDVFNHIYEFFSRYYDKGDFLSKRRYGGREKYYVPYNGEETLLHWATADQYYVKTGEYFKRYSFKAGGWRVNFVLKEAEVDPNSVKGGSRYFLLNERDIFRLDEANGEVDIHFVYRELTDDEEKRYGRGDVQDKITSEIADELFSQIGNKVVLTELRKKAVIDDVTLLEQHVRRYVTRNTTDYFIHKNLKAFLERELEFYLKNEVLDLDEIEHMNERNIRLNKAKIRAVRGISNKIISFLAQIEDFQKKLFEKKKFLETGYCLTLDMVPEEFYKEIGENERQVAEWKELFKLDEITKGTLQGTRGKKTLSADFLKSHKNLVLDTRFFNQEFKDGLLHAFENLDEEINGLMVKSENFQALNLLQEKYKEKMKCIYIDPPYNTGSDEFIYKDNYQHSSWLTMMENRLRLSKNLLGKESLLFSSIDNHEISDYIKLQKNIFGEQNLIEVIAVKNKAGAGAKPKGFISVHEYVTCFTLNYDNINSIEVPPSDENISLYNKKDDKYSVRGPYGTWALETTSMDERPNLRFPIIHNGEEIWPQKQWLWSKEKVLKAQKDNELVFNKKNDGTWSVRFKRYLRDENGKLRTATPTSFFDGPYTHEGTKEIDNLFGRRVYTFPKPSNLIKKLMQSDINGSEDKKSWLIDFFAGSGTTAHAVLNLNAEDGGNRKYILVEMANYFETVMKPRIQKRMFSKEWQDGVPASTEGTSHMFKYGYLEQ